MSLFGTSHTSIAREIDSRMVMVTYGSLCRDTLYKRSETLCINVQTWNCAWRVFVIYRFFESYDFDRP